MYFSSGAGQNFITCASTRSAASMSSFLVCRNSPMQISFYLVQVSISFYLAQVLTLVFCAYSLCSSLPSSMLFPVITLNFSLHCLFLQPSHGSSFCKSTIQSICMVFFFISCISRHDAVAHVFSLCLICFSCTGFSSALVPYQMRFLFFQQTHFSSFYSLFYFLYLNLLFSIPSHTNLPLHLPFPFPFSFVYNKPFLFFPKHAITLPSPLLPSIIDITFSS